MTVAAGNITLIVLDPRIIGADKVDVCNHCATGTHLAPEHVRSEYQCSYLSVDCPLCGRVGLKTRARVRKIIATTSP